jgi:peptidoglycan/LPS O-acetylase OafA/YrhL
LQSTRARLRAGVLFQFAPQTQSARRPGIFIVVIPFAEIRRVVSGRMPALDGLRGFALLLVLANHLYFGSDIVAQLAGGPLLRFMEGAWVAVESFFVLSGFLITGILLDTKGAGNYFSSFYARRALRILPVSYLTLFVAFILCPVLGKLGVTLFPKEFSKVQLWYWFYAGNMAWLRGTSVRYLEHFWSLAAEEQFYFVWPWLVLATSRRTLAKVSILLVLLAPIQRILLSVLGVSYLHIYFLASSHLDTLGLGALAALIVRDEKWVRRILPRLNYFIYPGLLLFCLVGWANGSFDIDAGFSFVLGAFPMAICLTGLLLRLIATTGSRSPLQRFLNTGLLRSCGKYSYAIYVVHFPLIRFYGAQVLPYILRSLHDTALRPWLLHPDPLARAFLILIFILYFVAPFCFLFWIGKFSWWAFEGPINGQKKYFEPRFKSDIPAGVATSSS